MPQHRRCPEEAGPPPPRLSSYRFFLASRSGIDANTCRPPWRSVLVCLLKAPSTLSKPPPPHFYSVPVSVSSAGDHWTPSLVHLGPSPCFPGPSRTCSCLFWGLWVQRSLRGWPGRGRGEVGVDRVKDTPRRQSICPDPAGLQAPDGPARHTPTPSRSCSFPRRSHPKCGVRGRARYQALFLPKGFEARGSQASWP